MSSRVNRLNEQTKLEKLEKKKIRKEKNKGLFKKLLIIAIIFAIVALLYSFFIEPHILLINEHNIITSKITEPYNGLKIVHFSDLHYGKSIKSKNIDKIINQINELKPDIVFFTGDLFEEGTNLSEKEIDKLTLALSKINATLGKYAILGNHDINTEYEKYYDNIFSGSNFLLLNNSYDLIYKGDNHPIMVYGLDDILYGNPSFDGLKDLILDENTYKIVLVHEPDYITEIPDDYNIDLVLSGHSHNGQIKIPFIRPILLPPGSKKYYSPYYKVNNMDLYISNGVGTTFLPLRFGTPPSINLYRLTNK